MNIHNFPILYKENKNKIRFWKIYVVEKTDKTAEIYTEYGIIGGKITKPSPQIINKQIGKTSCFKRAINLANTKWKNKKITDFFIEKNESNNEKSKNINFKPMKPTDFEKFESYIKYPAYIQPKLDGFRLFSFIKNNELLTLSRQQKEVKHINNIRNELLELFNKHPNYILDGEIIGEGITLKDIKSILSKKDAENINKLNKLKYYVFDLIDKDNLDLSFEDRLKILKNIIKNYNYIKIVPTFTVNNKDQVVSYVNKYKKLGYEGIMIRNKVGIYKYNASSKDVQKIKLYYLDDFKIVDFDQGKGDDKGTVIWVVQCLKNKNKKFRVKPKGTREERRYYFNNAKNYIGKKLQVSYFEKDDEGCVVRIKTGEIKK